MKYNTSVAWRLFSPKNLLLNLVSKNFSHVLPPVQEYSDIAVQAYQRDSKGSLGGANVPLLAQAVAIKPMPLCWAVILDQALRLLRF